MPCEDERSLYKLAVRVQRVEWVARSAIMVLWEITLGTAYFLGLKRTYKLALKIQRYLVGPNHPKIRQVLQSRIRSVFDFALTTHRKIQERDIEVGRNLGNWILRHLDKMKPEAQIRGPHPPQITAMSNLKKHPSNPPHPNKQASFSRCNTKKADGESDRHLFTAARSIWARTLPAISMIRRSATPSGSSIQHGQYRQYGTTLGSHFLTSMNYRNFM